MSNNRRALRFWLRAWLPVVAGVAVIVVESTAMFGADRTSSPLRWLVQSLFGPVSDANWNNIHHLIRKSGHFIGYGTLGVLWLRAWRMTLPGCRFLLNYLRAVCSTALVATWDEWHQTFLPNRQGSPWDVLLDSIGAIVLIGLAYLYLRLFRPDRLAYSA